MPPSPPIAESPGAEIARALRLRWDGAQSWPHGECWAFTDAEPRSPYYRMTFYVAPGATLQQVAARLEQKRQQYTAAAA